MGSFDGSCERQTETWRDDTYLLVICIYSIIHCLSFMDQQVESVDLGQLSLLSCKGAKSVWPLVARIYRPSNTHITTYCLIRLAIRVHTSRNQIHLDSSGLADWKQKCADAQTTQSKRRSVRRKWHRSYLARGRHHSACSSDHGLILLLPRVRKEEEEDTRSLCKDIRPYLTGIT